MSSGHKVEWAPNPKKMRALGVKLGKARPRRITTYITPSVYRGLKQRAKEHGVTVLRYMHDVLHREAGPTGRRAQERAAR